jgi:hypothetical protein
MTSVINGVSSSPLAFNFASALLSTGTSTSSISIATATSLSRGLEDFTCCPRNITCGNNRNQKTGNREDKKLASVHRSTSAGLPSNSRLLFWSCSSFCSVADISCFRTGCSHHINLRCISNNGRLEWIKRNWWLRRSHCCYFYLGSLLSRNS